MVRSPLQKRLASALLLVTIAVQLNVSGAWSALQNIPVFMPFIGVQHADAQSATRSFTSNDQIRAFVTSTPGGVFVDGATSLRNDNATASKICKMAGYNTVLSKSCVDPRDGRCNYTSCGDNFHQVWNGSAWSRENSCGGTWLGQLTCSDPTVPTVACNDGIDNDGDGLRDFPADPGCVNAQDTDESNGSTPQCQDGIDNDGDGKIDALVNATTGGSGGGNFVQENADPKYSKTWIVAITCRTAAGNNVTYNQGGSSHTLIGLVRQAIVNKGLNLTQPTQSIVRSDGGTGAGFNWNDDSGSPHMPTLTAVCQILGSSTDTYVSSTCRDDERSGIYPNGKCNFHSPGNNNMHRFTGTLSSAACSDGVDNDGDGARDFPADSGCASANDASEVPHDPQCTDPNDGTEADPLAQCQDGIDNDGDGAMDFPNDFSCSSPTDNDETNPKAACQDGVDNDNDGLTDFPQDPGCVSRQDNDEFNQVTQCNDGIDNDGDGYADLADAACTDPTDDDEGNDATCQGITAPANVVAGQPFDAIATFRNNTTKTWNATAANAGNGFKLGTHDARWTPTRFVLPGNVSPNQSVTVNFRPTAPTTPGTYPFTWFILEEGKGALPQSCTRTITVTAPLAQCQDGVDNDGDGATDTQDFSCSSPTDNDETNPKAACQDGVDNDNDGRVDFPQDPGCVNNQDNDEFNQLPQCQDGIDNDGDGATDFPADFSCTSPTDNDETNQKAACQDGVDNDGDGLVDFPQDPGCVSNQDNDEFNAPTTVDLSIQKTGPASVIRGQPIAYTLTVQNSSQIQATNVVVTDAIPAGLVYNDLLSYSSCSLQGSNVVCPLGTLNAGQNGSFTITFDTPAIANCVNPVSVVNTATITSTQTDSNQANNTASTQLNPTRVDCPIVPQCQDGIDNDGDGAADFPNDFSCSSPTDNDETNPKAACQDGVDNDNDGLTDFPQDPGCASRQDNDESNLPLPACRDGIDNDNDGRVDMLDPGCSNPDDTNEGDDPACSDRIDNDSDGLIDFPFDPGCASPTDTDEFNQIQTVDLTIQKTGPASIVRGQTLFYSILVGNSGTTQATNVTVSDTVPAGLVYNDSLSYGPCSLSGNVVSCPLGTLAANQFGSFTIAFDTPTVQNCSQVSVTNVATIAATQQDSNPANNTSSTQGSPTRIDCPVQTTQCNDFNDNDFDGRIDFPADPGCSSPTDNNENDEAACQDGRDNDFDGRIDFPQDPGCASPTDTDETNPVTPPQCRDGIDNDGDGRVDSLDPGCSNPDDTNESDDPACSDRRDNDFDGLVDFPQDPGCASPTDTDEFNAPNTQCRDGIDNDGDGRIDTNDAGCTNGDDNNEGDGATDLGIALTGPATVQGGSTAAYVATISNNGPDAATSPFSIRVSIPTGVTFNAAQSSQGCTQQGTAVVCSNITLGLFQQTTRSIVFNVPGNGQQVTSTFNLLNFALGVEKAHAQVGGICNTTFQVVATIQTSPQGDPNTTNNQSQVTTFVSCQALAQCQDGIDNDGDGKVDFPADPGCSSATDTDETDVAQFGCVEIKKETFDPHGNPLPIAAQFTFILDATRVAYNDASGRARFDNLTPGAHSVAEIIPSGWTQLSVSPQNGMVTVTPGTTCAQVTFRNRQVFVANAQCADGYDNDGDGLTDYPQDQGCSSATDNDEYNSTFVPQCSDNVDNDGDGLKDFPQDTGCENAADNNEQNAGVPIVYACSDNVDNDGDGLKDFPLDPGCVNAQDTDESNGVVGTFACNDGVDNDGDGVKDYPQDPGCSSATDTDEFNFRAPRCSDGIDNDGDGLKDFPQDTGCTTAYDDNEYNDRLWLDRWREFWNWNW